MKARLAITALAIGLALSPYTFAQETPPTQSENDADQVVNAQRLLPEATTPQGARVRGMARLRIARASRDDGRLADFAREIDEVIVDLRQAQPEATNALGVALNMRGKMLHEEGLYLQALPQFEEAAGYLAGHPDSEPDYVEAMSLQAFMLSRIERYGEAIDLSDRLIADVEMRHAPDTRMWASTHFDRIEILMSAGKWDEAIKQLSSVRAAIGSNVETFIAGRYFDSLAGIEIELKKYAEAAKSAERAIQIFQTAMPETPAQQLEPMRKRARASEGMFDSAFTDRAFSDLIALSVRVYHADHPEVARDLNAYGNFLDHTGRLEEAEALFRRAVVGLERAYGGTGQKFLYGLNNLANAITRNGRSEEAAQLLERGLEIIGNVPGQAETRALLRANYAGTLNLLGREKEALEVVLLIRNELSALGQKGERYALAADMVSVSSLASLGQLKESWRAGAQALDRIYVRTNEDAVNSVILLLQMSDVARRGGDAKNAWAATSGAAKLMAEYRIETSQRWRELAERSVPLLWQLSQN